MERQRPKTLKKPAPSLYKETAREIFMRLLFAGKRTQRTHVPAGARYVAHAARTKSHRVYAPTISSGTRARERANWERSSIAKRLKRKARRPEFKPKTGAEIQAAHYARKLAQRTRRANQ